MYDHEEVVTASFLRCSINTCRLTSSVSTWPPSWKQTELDTSQNLHICKVNTLFDGIGSATDKSRMQLLLSIMKYVGMVNVHFSDLLSFIAHR